MSALDVLLLTRIQHDGADLEKRGKINFVGATVTDDAANGRTNVTFADVVPQESYLCPDATPRYVGTGITLPADTFTSLDAELHARDASSWAIFRVSRGFMRLGSAAPVADAATAAPTGWPRGSNAGAPPAGWAATIEVSGNVAYVRVTGAATWYWYFDGLFYPAPTTNFVGPIGGGIVTVTSITPNNGSSAGEGGAVTVTSITSNTGSTAGG